jgi:peptide/nickel transport system substrate-binding protein
VLERFDKYFLAGKPYLDKIIININPDSSNLMLGLERGEIQMIPYATNSTELKRFANNPTLNLTNKGFEGIGALNWLAFNTAKKPMSDVNVRKAIAMTIDKNFISKALHGGFLTACRWPNCGQQSFRCARCHSLPPRSEKICRIA